MSGKKHKTLCTIDHSNKQSDAIDWNAYDYWLKQARKLKAARQRQLEPEFRRDRPLPDKS